MPSTTVPVQTPPKSKSQLMWIHSAWSWQSAYRIPCDVLDPGPTGVKKTGKGIPAVIEQTFQSSHPCFNPLSEQFTSISCKLRMSKVHTLANHSFYFWETCKLLRMYHGDTIHRRWQDRADDSNHYYLGVSKELQTHKKEERAHGFLSLVEDS